MEEVWKESWECLKALLEKTIKDYEQKLEKKDREIIKLLEVIEGQK